ncbi:MAG: DegV family protein [Lachnospiraceae bacterium]|nr:DegV family protein [Lachnospiraceae bacterium]
MSYVIIVDSASNLVEEQLSQYEIEIIPYYINVDGKEVSCFERNEDDVEKAKRFYDHIRKGGDAHTSLINPERFCACFEPYLQQGRDVVFIGISSGLSGTVQAAKIAAEMLSEKYPERKCIAIDSMAASLGEGIMAIELSQARARGEKLEDSIAWLEKNRLKMACSFSVGDIKYLLKGGRVGSAVAKIGSVLNIKPMLYASNEGKIALDRPVRGRKKALDTLVQKFLDAVVRPEEQIIGIAHCDCKPDADYVIGKILEKCKVKGVINNYYDLCTGAHVGPDAIALFYRVDAR